MPNILDRVFVAIMRKAAGRHYTDDVSTLAVHQGASSSKTPVSTHVLGAKPSKTFKTRRFWGFLAKSPVAKKMKPPKSSDDIYIQQDFGGGFVDSSSSSPGPSHYHHHHHSHHNNHYGSHGGGYSAGDSGGGGGC